MGEDVPGFAANVADVIANRFGPLLHAAIVPENLALFIGDADAFADGLEDETGLLRGQGAFGGEESGRIGKDGIDGPGAKFSKGVLDGIHEDDIMLGFQQIDERTVAGVGPGQHQETLRSGSASHILHKWSIRFVESESIVAIAVRFDYRLRFAV